jgi:hypothetical protein
LLNPHTVSNSLSIVGLDSGGTGRLVQHLVG